MVKILGVVGYKRAVVMYGGSANDSIRGFGFVHTAVFGSKCGNVVRHGQKAKVFL